MPNAIDFCDKRAIRYVSDTHVYLLKKIRMSGLHAELFTFCLHEKLSTPQWRERLKPLIVADYAYQTNTDDDPHLLLRLRRELAFIRFQIYLDDGQFRTWTQLAPLEPFPKLQKLLTTKAGFAVSAEYDTYLMKSSPREEIETAIADLANLLASAPADLPKKN